MSAKPQTLTVVTPDEPKKESWAIDRPYRKPNLRKPHFGECPDVKLRKEGKHPEQQTHLKKRLKELVKTREAKKAVVEKWWRVVLNKWK
jgi:hypothetical protein